MSAEGASPGAVAGAPAAFVEPPDLRPATFDDFPAMYRLESRFLTNIFSPDDRRALFEQNPVPIQVEPKNAQAIYAVLDSAMSGVLTKKDANVNHLLSTAETKVNSLMAAGS